MTLRVVELFSGIGAQRMALTLAGIPHEVVAIAEINKHALASYEAIYGDCPNMGDITKVERLPDCDLVTYSFPCQDLSVAGKRAGMGEGTRSGLVWEVVRLLESAGERERPEWLLMENVRQVLTAPEWPSLVGRLEAMGYHSKWAKLDSSDFGSAQKRVRAFMVSRLNQEPPDLPTSAPNAPKLCLRDVMEPERAERYVRRIPLDMVKWRTPKTEAGVSTPAASIDGETFYSKAMLYSSSSSSPTVRTEHGKNSQIKVVDRGLSVVGEDLSEGQWKPHRLILDESGPARTVIENVNARMKSIKVVADWQRRGMDQSNRLYSSSSPSLMCHGGGERDVKVVDESEIKVVDPKIEPGGCYTKDGGLDMTMRHRTVSARKRRLYMGGGAAPTVLQSDGKIDVFEGQTTDGCLTISVLTPRECWRLMGFPEWAYLRASRVCSETQLYNQAGNSIVVEVLMAIFNAMFRPQKYVIQKRITEAMA